MLYRKSYRKWNINSKLDSNHPGSKLQFGIKKETKKYNRIHPWIGITKSILTSHFLLKELYAINYISSNKTEILIFCVLSCFTTMTIRKKSIFSYCASSFYYFLIQMFTECWWKRAVSIPQPSLQACVLHSQYTQIPRLFWSGFDTCFRIFLWKLWCWRIKSIIGNIRGKENWTDSILTK